MITHDMTAASLLGKLLEAFLHVLSAGMIRSIPDMLWLLKMLATMEVSLAVLAWYNAQAVAFERLVWKLVGVFFLMAIVDGWKWWIDHVRDGFIEMGLFIGDNAISRADFTDPGNIIDFGFSVTALIFQRIKELSWFSHGGEIFLSGLSAWVTVIFYIVMSAAVFKAILEYYIVCACGIFLVPFMSFEKTAFIGERVFGTIIAHAVRLMLLALLLNIALPILYTFKLPNDPQWQEVLLLFSASGVLAILAVGAQSMASGFIHGTPTLGWHSLTHGITNFTQTAAAVGAVGAGLSFAGARALQGAVGAGAALREAAHLGATEYWLNRTGTASSPQTPPSALRSTVIGGAQGIATYGMNRLRSSFRRTMAEGRARARAHYMGQP